jgi:hypothetical protein
MSSAAAKPIPLLPPVMAASFPSSLGSMLMGAAHAVQCPTWKLKICIGLTKYQPGG